MVHIDYTILISKDVSGKKLSWIEELFNWFMKVKKPDPKYIVYVKVHFEKTVESSLIRAGSILMIDPGYTFYLTARSEESFICKSIETVAEDAITRIEGYTGPLIHLSQADSEYLRRSNHEEK
jgi:hypothetical protein